MKKIVPVAAYIRVSSTEQKLHGLSLDAQKMKLKQYAKAHDMRIVGWYMDEGVSGRKLIKNRPELQRMINDAKQGEFERIIFIKLDRFFRSVGEYYECMKQIKPVEWTATEEPYDLTTANGRMLVNMKLTIAEMEADQTGERIKLVNEYKAATGQPLTGVQPFGWKTAKDEATGRKKVVKDPEQEPILEEIISYFLTYQSKRGIVTLLHSKYNINMPQHAVTALFSNTMLFGLYRGNPNYCEAYIDKETFDKIQEIMKRNIKENTAQNRVYYFSGLINCPNCNRVLAGQINTTVRTGRPTYKYKAYRCPKHRSSNACNFKKVVFEKAFERMLLDNLEQYVEDAKVRALEITESGEGKISKYDIDEINKEIERLNYSWQKGRIKTIEQYDKQYDELMEQLELAQKEQNETQKIDFEKIEAVLHSEWKDIYNALDDEHKRAFWRNIISSIDIEWHGNVKKISRVNFL